MVHRILPELLRPLMSCSRGAPRRQPRPAWGVERLEPRTLLATSRPFFKINTIRSDGVAYILTVSGPGSVRVQARRHGGAVITLVGTTQDSQLTISALGSRSHAATRPLAIGRIDVRTERLGSIQALTTGDLGGPITPLLGPVSSIQLDSMGPGAQVDVINGVSAPALSNGNVGQITVSRGISLGPSGHINVGNDLTGSLSVAGDVTLAGGQVSIGRDLAGGMNVGGLVTISNGGALRVGRNIGGATGAVATGGGASGGAAGSASGSGTGAGASGPGGSSGATVSGTLTLAGGQLSVGGNLSSLSVGGDLILSSGGRVLVAHNLGTLSVSGSIEGQAGDDIAVGDNLSQLTVLGGAGGDAGLQNVDITASGNIQGLDIRNGIAHSHIRAGYLINGGTPGSGSNGWNIGTFGVPADAAVDPTLGQIAFLDSTLRAGYEIANLTIGGDVVSDRPTNRGGEPARIVAGETLDGRYVPDGIVDNFQVVGSLVNAVVAASVGPNPSTGLYDQPAGVILVGFVAGTFPPDPGNDHEWQHHDDRERRDLDRDDHEQHHSGYRHEHDDDHRHPGWRLGRVGLVGDRDDEHQHPGLHAREPRHRPVRRPGRGAGRGGRPGRPRQPRPARAAAKPAGGGRDGAAVRRPEGPRARPGVPRGDRQSFLRGEAAARAAGGAQRDGASPAEQGHRAGDGRHDQPGDSGGRLRRDLRRQHQRRDRRSHPDLRAPLAHLLNAEGAASTRGPRRRRRHAGMRPRTSTPACDRVPSAPRRRRCTDPVPA